MAQLCDFCLQFSGGNGHSLIMRSQFADPLAQSGMPTPKGMGIRTSIEGTLGRIRILNNRAENILRGVRGSVPEQAAENMKNPNEPSAMELGRDLAQEIDALEHSIDELEKVLS
jgi:hypothetical protein